MLAACVCVYGSVWGGDSNSGTLDALWQEETYARTHCCSFKKKSILIKNKLGLPPCG